MPERLPAIESVFSAIEASGSAARGAFRLRAGERAGLLADVQTIALVGVAGRRGWDAFATSRPCLRACPVGAFSSKGYDVPACAARLRDAGGADCMGRGCLARRACPVGVAHAHGPQQAAFAMRAFLGARSARP